MIAALPMYLPAREQVEALWQALASLLREITEIPVPESLVWPVDYHAHWHEPALLISQTCGFPLSTQLRDKVQVLGAFAYDADGAEGIFCHSQLICRRGDVRTLLTDFAGGTLAYNATDSQSGYNALRALVATTSELRPFFGAAIETGSHGKSIASVISGKADLASIDCVTLALWQRDNRDLAQDVRVFARTPPYPGLPLITGLATTPAVLNTLRSALARLASEPRFEAARAPMLIRGFEPLELADYDRCLEMQAAAAQGGLTKL
jgi:ABC-type phosphate/phosphonate transport system substrate-binding protein